VEQQSARLRRFCRDPRFLQALPNDCLRSADWIPVLVSSGGEQVGNFSAEWGAGMSANEFCYAGKDGAALANFAGLAP
jgi:hypothetical protein